jgi:hypothetical protein
MAEPSLVSMITEFYKKPEKYRFPGSVSCVLDSPFIKQTISESENPHAETNDCLPL